MMKRTCFLFATLLFVFSARSQNKSYKSIDLGGEFQVHADGYICNLHVGLNTKMHHSFQARLGYNKVPFNSIHGHSEEGEGWGVGMGYRYFFRPDQVRFFAGARVDAWRMDIDIDYSPAGGPAVYTDPHWILHPAIEAGYTFLIHKKIFFTPYVTGGIQISGDTPASMAYGNGFITMAGVSAGIRF